METSGNPVLDDPLSDFSIVSLFPHTFNQLSFDPDLNSDPLEAFGAHLESLALKNANGLMEQTKMILDGGEEILNINSLVNGGGEDTLGNVHGVNNLSLQRDSENVKNAGDKDLNLLARRPALGRKRPRFSLKSNSSQSTEILKPYVDIDKLEDPEEFFSAFERQENAMKELRRQTGKPLMDLDQNVPLMEEKRRRPGLLRRSASYKHRFSIAPSGGAETFLSSQEALSQDLCSLSPSNNCLETQKTGQVSAVQERPGDVDDEIPSTPDKDDESDEIIGMLQKRFKPVEINKSCLPELNSALQSELISVRESLHDSQDKMPDLHAIVSTIAKELPLGGSNLERHSGHPSTSPRTPKSPHSSISLLKDRLFQYRKGKDSFSNVDVDLSSAGKDGSYKDTYHLASRDLQKFVKDSMKMQNTSTVNSVIIESGYRSGESDARETNLKSSMHESELNALNIDTQDLGGAEFTSSEINNGGSTNSGIPSGSVLQLKSDDDFAQTQHGESDVNPTSRLHGKECDSPHNMQTTKDISMTISIYSDVEMHTEPDHVIQRNQSPKPAAHETESNVVPDKNIHDFAADNLEPAEENIKDYSMGSGIALNMTPDAELDNDIMPHNATVGVMEDDPSKVSDYPASNVSDYPASKVSDAAVISVDEHMEPDHGVLEEDLAGCNIEKPHCAMGIALNITPGAELDHETMPHNTTDGVMEDDPSKVSEDSASKVSDAAVFSVDNHMEPDHGVLEEDHVGCIVEKPHCDMDQSRANAVVEGHGEDICLSGAEDNLDHDRPSCILAQPLKKTQKASSSKIAERDRSKTREPAGRRAVAATKHKRECKEFSRRKSLAACGTQWKGGIRRSTRIRTRPLEFWNGERQLYGRIHETLVTVIGAKYFSPTKEAGQAALKVKSYVSDDYKEIVERAALH